MKLLKWIYQLGYDKGYADALASSKMRFYTPKTPQNDAQFMEEIDELINEPTTVL